MIYNTMTPAVAEIGKHVQYSWNFTLTKKSIYTTSF